MTVQMVRLSCKHCKYKIEVQLSLEDWARQLILKHYQRKHPEYINETERTPITEGSAATEKNVSRPAFATASPDEGEKETA